MSRGPVEATDRKLTPRELDVMGAVWKRDGATVAEVQEELGDDLAYTTVLTVMRGLEQKGWLTHEREGRAYRYLPTRDPQQAGKGLLDRLLEKVYLGSPVQLVTHLVAESDLTEDEIEELRAVLDEAKEGSPDEAGKGSPDEEGR